MKVLVVYDSAYGNTEQIAKAIGSGIAGDAKVVRVGQVDTAGLEQADLLVVGSPTLGGRATQPIQDFLANVPEAYLKGRRVASFDTRYAGKFVKVFGFAADRIGESLTSKGAVLVTPPEPFFVKGKKGPLKEGELERAAVWAKGLVK